MKITNLVMWVQDASLSVKFYKKLGFTVVRSTEQSASVRLDQFELVLVTMRDEEEFNEDALSSVKGKGVYIYVHVDENVDSFYHKLIQNGVTPRTEPRDWPWGNRGLLLRIPMVTSCVITKSSELSV